MLINLPDHFEIAVISGTRIAKIVLTIYNMEFVPDYYIVTSAAFVNLESLVKTEVR